MRVRPVSFHIAKYFLCIIILVGIIGPLLTSNAPWKWENKNETHFPAWTIYLDNLGIVKAPSTWKNIDWNQIDGKSIKNTIPYNSTYIDLESIGAKEPSLFKRHYLGTDLLGRDVLAGLIQGCYTSLIIGFLATFITLIISLLISVSTSYVGNDQIKLNWIQLLGLVILVLLSSFYLFIAFPASSIFPLILRLLILSVIVVFTIRSMSQHQGQKLRKYSIPMDDIGLKVYEIYKSIPSLILLLLIIGLIPKKGIFILAIIIGLLRWPGLYRYLRIELLQEKAKDSFLALKNMGYSNFRIIFNHTLPSILKTIATPIIFLIISAIITEATLSFLGIGLSDDIVSWGKILAQARQRIDAWWLVLFPGLLLFFTLYSLSIVSKNWKVN